MMPSLVQNLIEAKLEDMINEFDVDGRVAAVLLDCRDNQASPIAK